MFGELVLTGVPVPLWTPLSSVLQVDSSIALSDEASLVDAETSSSSVSSSTTVSTQSSGKSRKPPKVLQISPPTLLVTASDFSPMSLCSPSLPTASLTPAMIPVSVWGGRSAQNIGTTPLSDRGDVKPGDQPHLSFNVCGKTGSFVHVNVSSSVGQ